MVASDKKMKGEDIDVKQGVALVAVLAVLITLLPFGANGQALSDKKYTLSIPSSTIKDALFALARETGRPMVIPSDGVDDTQTNALKGTYTIFEALFAMLKDTNFSGGLTESGVITISRKPPSQNEGEEMKGKTSIRNNKTGLFAGIAALFATAMATPDAVGQTGENQSKADTIDEITVTAMRREQSLQDVPLSISVVFPDEFKAAGLTNLVDIIDYTPGINFSNRIGRPGSGGTVTARGVSQQGGTPVVGIYMDDVALSNNGPYGNGEFAFDGLLGDIERVELLKGPQGTLYGATSVGGAIKYITRKPTLRNFRGNAGVNLSTTDDGGFNQIYSGRISTPIIEDSLGITVSGFYEDNAGFVDRVDSTSGALIEKDSDDFERFGVSGDIYYQFSDRLDFRFRVLHQESSFTNFSKVDLNVNTLEPRFESLTSIADASSHDVKNTYFSGTFEYRFDWATLVSTSSYVKDNWDFTLDLTPLLSLTADFLQGAPFGTTTSVALLDDGGSDKFTQEVRLTSESSDTWEWILGFYYADESTFRFQNITSQPNTFNLFDTDGPSNYKEYAIFGNLTYYLTADFDFTIGARISKNQMDVESSGSGPFSGPAVSQDIDDTVDTWLFAARYRATEDMSFYARVASGYRPAPANLPIIDPLTGNNVSPSVASDTLWSYEVGAKGELAGGRFFYDFALWHIDWEQFQTSIIFNGFGTFGNAAHGIKAKGVEGTFTLKPSEDLSVISTFAYTRSALDEDEPQLDGLEGQQVPFVPKWTVSTQARYDFSPISGIEAHIGGGFRYVGRTRSDFTDGGAFVPGRSNALTGGPFDSAFNIPTDSYFLVDLNASVSKGNLSLNLYATNLFNKKALASSFGRNVNGALEATGVPIRPRTIGAAISIDY